MENREEMATHPSFGCEQAPETNAEQIWLMEEVHWREEHVQKVGVLS